MPFTTINEQNIFYVDSGGDKSPLLFLHGFLFDQSMFDAQVAVLSESYRCICVDTRGFGQTIWDGEAFTLYDVVSDCVGLLDSLNIDQVTLVGMSQGGYAGVRFALKHPERLKSMILISTRKDIESVEFEKSYAILRDQWVKNGATDFAMNSMMTVLIGPKDTFGAYWDIWRSRWASFDGNRMYHTMNALLDRNPVTEEQIREIKLPVYSIHGLEDQGTPVLLADQLYELFPNGRGRTRVARAAHAVNMTHAAEVTPAMQKFLAEIY